MLNGAIIGLGVGEAHITGYNSHPDGKTVALCNFGLERIKAAKQSCLEFGKNINTKDAPWNDNDLDCCILRFENGGSAKVTANYRCVFPHFHQLHVYGATATFFNSMQDGLLYRSRDPHANPGKMTASHKDQAKGYMIPDFIQGILEKEPFLVDKEDIFKTTSVCFAIEQASQSNSNRTVNFL